MKMVKILCSIFTAAISTLSILQYVVLILPENSETWNYFQKFLYQIITAPGWIWVLILMFALLVLLTILDIRSSTAQQHHFKVQSSRFKKFFKKWYSQPGKLIVICDDIDWTCDQNDASIYHTLEEKCREGLTLYLGKGYNSERVEQLKNLGAKVFKAKPALIRYYSFSCLAPMDHYSNIIIRDKNKDVRQEVKFSELSDEYVITLLTALLEEN